MNGMQGWIGEGEREATRDRRGTEGQEKEGLEKERQAKSRDGFKFDKDKGEGLSVLGDLSGQKQQRIGEALKVI